MPAWFPPCATSISLRSISVAGWRPITGLASAVHNFDFAPLHLSRGLAPYACLVSSVRNFDFAPLHLSRGHSPYTDNKKCLPESKLSSDTFIIVARLITITKALFLCITDSMFL